MRTPLRVRDSICPTPREVWIAFIATVACEPIEKKLREAQKRGVAEPHSVLSAEELAQWQRKEALRKEVIRVDDFPQDFGRAELVLGPEPAIAAKAA